MGVITLPFDGATYEPEDSPRLSEQLQFVLLILKRGEWYSAEELQGELKKYQVKAGTAGITARIRDLRKPKFGGHNIPHKRIKGVDRYRLLPKEALW